MRLIFVGAASALAFAVAMGACLPHPSGDYDDFIDETANLRAGEGQADGGGQTIDAEVPIEVTKGAYLAACLASLSGNRADKALRFYAETTFTPVEGAGVGTLGLVLYPFPVANTVFDKANVVGTPIDVGTLPVSDDSRFSGQVARSEITKEANTISPRDIVIENTKLAGIYTSAGNFCSSFDTTVTAPIEQPIVAKCTYIPLQTGDTYQVVAPSGADAKSAIVAGGVEYTSEKFGCSN